MILFMIINIIFEEIMRTNYLLLLLILITAFLSGCEDRSIVSIYDKNILKQPPKCLALMVMPPNKGIEKRLKKIYKFDDKCKYRMEVSWKSNIHCTSNQNSEKKALSAFPNSFLRIDIRKGMRVSYDYYIDLTKPATADDVEDAMERIIKDLKLKH